MFISDLNFGKKYEEIAKQNVPKGESVIESPDRKCKEYDFKTNVSAYEVKADRNAYKYGNKTMFIEYECNNQRSGINATTADYWFYFMVNPNGKYICYEISVALLKEKCKTARSLSGGDGGRVKGYIVPITDETIIINTYEKL